MRSWKLSCADFTFPLLSHENALKLIRMLDVPAVDLGLFSERSHVPPEQVARDVAAAAREVKDRLDGLLVADVFLQTGAHPPISAANTPDAIARARNRALFESAVEFTSLLGCRHITGLPGVRHDGIDEPTDWARAVEEAAWRLERARSGGITYAVEAHVGSITPDPASADRLINSVPGLTLTLDYGHFIYAGLSDEQVHPLLPHASHLHFRGGAPGRLQVNMSRNTIDFVAISRRLDEMGYPGFACLEYVWIDWQGCNESDNIAETIQLKRIVEESRRGS